MTIDAPSVIYAKVQGKGDQWYPDGYDVKYYANGTSLVNATQRI